MKKMLSIILCICMLASLSACTTKDTTTNDTTTNEDTTKETLKSLSSFSEPNVNETFDYTGYTNKELYKWGKGIVLPVQNPQNSQAEISTEEGYNIKLTCSNKSDIDKYVNDMKLDDWFCYTNNESGIYSFLKNNMALILTKNRDKNSEFIENKFNLTFIMGKEEESNKEKINTLEE